MKTFLSTSGLNKNTAFFGLHTSNKMCAEQLIIPRDKF